VFSCDRWLDKLGLSAQRGIGVVMRQTLYGYNYALLDVDMNPNPVTILIFFFRRLARGNGVRGLTSGLTTLHPRCIQETLVVRDRDGRPSRGSPGSALFLCV